MIDSPFRTEYYRYIRSLSFRNVESIIFDQMLPRISNYYTEADMNALVRPLANGTPFIQRVQGNSWHARITKSKEAP